MNLFEHLSGDIAKALKARGETVAVAESASGGLVSAALLAVPGASAYFQGGAVVYTLNARRELLGLTRDDVAGLEPLSEAMVSVFAERVRTRLGTTWGLAELGAAGPAGTRYGHDPGISVIAVAGPRSAARTVETGSGDRKQNMARFTEALLTLFLEVLARG